METIYILARVQEDESGNELFGEILGYGRDKTVLEQNIIKINENIKKQNAEIDVRNAEAKLTNYQCGQTNISEIRKSNWGVCREKSDEKLCEFLSCNPNIIQGMLGDNFAGEVRYLECKSLLDSNLKILEVKELL